MAMVGMSKWRDELYVTIYELVRGGSSMNEVAQAIGVTDGTLKKWHAENPVLRETVARAKALKRGGRGQGERFQDFCYRRLPDHLRQLWDDLEAADRTGNPDRAIEKLLENQGKRTRQMLVVHALTTTARWNISEALRKIGESRATWDEWLEEDPDFRELVTTTIKEMKKDYIEGAYFGLVAAGDTAAILFGMRTLNADRGYGTKVNIEHKHEGSVLHAHVELDKLPVDVDTKRKILEAIRTNRPADAGSNEARALKPAIAPELLIDEDEG